MKKIKQWIKNHKKELVAGAIAVGGTSLFFLIKENRLKGIRGFASLTLNFGVDDHGKKDDIKQSTYLTLRNSSFTISDLGKLGSFIKEEIPYIKDDQKIGHLSVNYNI